MIPPENQITANASKWRGRRKHDTTALLLPLRLSSTVLLLIVISTFLTAVRGSTLPSGSAHNIGRHVLEAALGSELLVDREINGRPASDDSMEYSTKARRSNHLPPRIQVPHAFDTSLGTNFTSPGCPTFFKQLLSDSDFTSCVPVSLMLQNSASFFDDTKSKALISKVLDVACSAPKTHCSDIMKAMAKKILSPSACLADYDAKSPIVVGAYAGFVSYDAVRKVTCMRDTNPGPHHGDYCYADAVTNSSSPTSSYIYYLPLGVKLPSGAMPACNSCLKRTMKIFASWATDPTEALSLTYPSAATSINIICGPNFADANVKVMSSPAAHHRSSGVAPWLASSLVILLVVLQ